VTLGVVGLLLSIIRWRKYLLIGPIVVPFVVLAILTFTPGVAQRLLKGFSKSTVDTERPVGLQGGAQSVTGGKPDMYTVTSGRTFAWPFVIDKIVESPAFGYGREAMMRTGLQEFLWKTYLESFPHPHNAYLEFLLDNGVVGFLMVLPFYAFIISCAVSLFMDSRSPVFVAIGGVTCALVFSLLIAAFGSQTFYPREGSVGMWCAIGLALRVWLERARVVSRQAYSPLETPVTLAVAKPETQRGQLSAHRPGALLRARTSANEQASQGVIDQMLWARAA
jgi:O-antigen ligase